MSLILDALRKIDRQKSLNRKGTDDLAISILDLDASPPGKKWRLYLAAVCLTAVATAAITYLAVVGFGSWGNSTSPPTAKLPPSSEHPARDTWESGPSSKVSPAPSEKPSLTSRQIPLAPPKPGTSAKSSLLSMADPGASHPQSEPISSAGVPPKKVLIGDSTPSLRSSREVTISSSAPVSPAEASPSASKVRPNRSFHPTPASLPREPVHEVQSGKTRDPSGMEARPQTKAPASAADKKIAAPNSPSEKVDQSVRMAPKPAEPMATGPSSSPPRLKISGIVWHDEPSKRRAVINGTFTNEGSVIEGVKVVEILPTRVRFLYQGRPFEISIFE